MQTTLPFTLTICIAIQIMHLLDLILLKLQNSYSSYINLSMANLDCLLELSTDLNSFKHFWKIMHGLNVVARRIHGETKAKISPDIILL